MKIFKQKFRKKAQGMSMNIIIMAVIALIVLAVLIIIFYGKAKLFSQADSCINQGGACADSSGKCTKENPIISRAKDCPSPDPTKPKEPGICCLAIAR
ncbi:hypothetical protein ACFL0W_05130 [Nanoarchaeota archaeon]